MEHFVTLFNRMFLPQGLALHRSMERNIPSYKLWILCVDDQTYDAIGDLGLVNVRRLKLSELETPELLQVKSERTIGEYCWTVTPFAPKFVFDADPNVSRVTYVDADLWFRKNPSPIFAEFDASSKKVLITDHGYAPEYDQSATSGQYCVQFMTFDRYGGEAVRKWWEERCIEWCFGRFEDGKFGDQKYLDDWPVRFGELVHVMRDKGLALAPWNASHFAYGNAVFYHFHGLRLKSSETVEIGNYLVPQITIENVYRPYYQDLLRSIEDLKSIGYSDFKQMNEVALIDKFVKILGILRARLRIFFIKSHHRLR